MTDSRLKLTSRIAVIFVGTVKRRVLQRILKEISVLVLWILLKSSLQHEKFFHPLLTSFPFCSLRDPPDTEACCQHPRPPLLITCCKMFLAEVLWLTRFLTYMCLPALSLPSPWPNNSASLNLNPVPTVPAIFDSFLKPVFSSPFSKHLNFKFVWKCKTEILIFFKLHFPCFHTAVLNLRTKI